MPPRPSISVKRPHRVGEAGTAPPAPIAPSAIPAIDPESPDTLAFSMQGRASTAVSAGTVTPEHAAAEVARNQGSVELRPESRDPDLIRQQLAADAGAGVDPIAESDSGYGLISIKLPPDVGRQLAAIADRRGSKRTLIAVEVLSEPLRALAAAHRAGEFPELPKIVSGTVRSSIAFALPAGLAADLEYVLKTRRAVRAQVVTRLLAPAVRALYDTEVGRRGR